MKLPLLDNDYTTYAIITMIISETQFVPAAQSAIHVIVDPLGFREKWAEMTVTARRLIH
jgi:hypothetical protein